MSLVPKFQPTSLSKPPIPRSKQNIRSGACGNVRDCEITLILLDEHSNRQRLYACRHRLAAVSRYFDRVFKNEEKEKCINNTVKLANVSRINVLLFLRTTANDPGGLMAIPELNRYVSGLITMAGRFQSDFLKERITRRIEGISFGACAFRTKKMMIIAADKVKEECPTIMENCVRLCASLKCHQIATLHNQISISTMASIYLLRYQFYFKPPLCTVTKCRNQDGGLKQMSEYQCQRFGKNGKWTHSDCYGRKKVCTPPTIFELLKMDVDKKLMLDQSKWREI